MAHLFGIHEEFFLILVLAFVIKPGQSQTVCTYRVPVPDLDVCDASGGIEDNINAGMFEVKGNINGMQDYQADNFKLMDQQINRVVKVTDQVNTEISDIGNELETLKRTLTNIQTLQTHLHSNGTSPNSSGRGKRAASTKNQLSQDLDAVKQAFQQSVIALDTQLQTLAQQVTKFEQQTTTAHRRYQTQLAQNQQDLNATETQLTTIARTVQSLAASGTTFSSASAPGSSQLRQDVTNLVVDAKTAEQVAQRQIDNLDKKSNTMQAVERMIQSDIQTTTTSLNNTASRISSVEQQTLQTTIAERMFGDLVGDIVTNNTLKMIDAKKLLTNTSATLAQLGQDVLQNIVTASNLGREIAKVKQDVTGVQSLVTFSQGVSSSQSTDLLNLRMSLLDDIHVLQYAFGARSIPP